ncbi:Uncharacterized protein KIAA2026 [Trichoplax sp. H2]|nr:Uncharacterized protein KIAA2026 [Trichoplax sp. H2]|eukprot:RDD39160.1 Uncharacterized protein KIAA2026 [Trichoplax sp. H2]
MDSGQENSQPLVSNEKSKQSTTEIEETPIEQSTTQSISDDDIVNTLSAELFQGWKLVNDLLSNQFASMTWPFREPVDTEKLGLWDYYDRIKQPMCLVWIKKKFYDSSYTTINEVLSDIRLMIENCYRYNGSKHWISKLGQKLEKTIEQKINLFPKSLRDKLRGNSNDGEDNANVTSSRRRCNRSSGTFDFATSIVAKVKLEEEEEEKIKRKQKQQEAREASLAMLEEINNWQKEYAPLDSVKEIRSYWQVPAIAQLFFLCQDSLNLRNVCLEELELGLIMPHRSYLMARIFSSLLLDPKPRQYLDDKKAMPYNVWDHKLKNVLKLWYETKDELNEEMVLDKFGLASDLFEVLGDKEEIITTPFHELSLRKRVYLLKALCDHVTELELRDVLTQYGPVTLREIVLGQDDKGATYFYFPGFLYLDLRVYKHDPVTADILKRKKRKAPARTVKEIPVLPTPHKRPERLRQFKSANSSPPTRDPPKIVPKSQTITNPDSDFELLCDSCDSLKELCESLAPIAKRRSKSNPDSSVKYLLETLKQLLSDVLPWDYKLQRTQARIKNKLMRECTNPMEDISVEDWQEPTRIPKKKEGKDTEKDDAASEDDDSSGDPNSDSHSNSDSSANESSIAENHSAEIDHEDESVDCTSKVEMTELGHSNKRKRKIKQSKHDPLESESCNTAPKANIPSTIPAEETRKETLAETSYDDKEYLIGIPAKKSLPSIPYIPPTSVKPYDNSSGTNSSYSNSLYSNDDGINANPVQVMYSNAQSTGTAGQSSSSLSTNIDMTRTSSPNVNYSAPFTAPQTANLQNSSLNVNNQNVYHRSSNVFTNYSRDHNSYYYPANNNYNAPMMPPRQDNYSNVNGGQRLQTAYNLVQFSSQRQHSVQEVPHDNSNKKPHVDAVDYSNSFQYGSNNSVNYNNNVTKDSQLNTDSYNLYQQQNMWTPRPTNLNSNSN